MRGADHAGARRHLMHVAAFVALLGALAPAAALLAMMIRSFVAARRSRTAA